MLFNVIITESYLDFGNFTQAVQTIPMKALNLEILPPANIEEPEHTKFAVISMQYNHAEL